MRSRARLLVLPLLLALGAACGSETDVEPEARAGASPEVQRLVAEIDAMLVVPQEEYPDGNDFSAMFEALFGEVVKQERTLRTNRVAQNMGYFIANGHGIGWDPKEEDVARLARDWSEFRPDVVAGP